MASNGPDLLEWMVTSTFRIQHCSCYLFKPDVQEIIGFYWYLFRYINAAKSESLDELPDHQTRREAPSAGKVTSRDRVSACEIHIEVISCIDGE